MLAPGWVISDERGRNRVRPLGLAPAWFLITLLRRLNGSVP